MSLAGRRPQPPGSGRSCRRIVLGRRLSGLALRGTAPVRASGSLFGWCVPCVRLVSRADAGARTCSRAAGVLAYSGRVGEIPLEDVSREVTDAAHDAARGQVVYLTEHGERLAAIVPAELAAELESLTPAQFRELLEDFADAQAAREALAELDAGAEPVPAEQVWADLGLGT
jgi:hypothetical protein